MNSLSLSLLIAGVLGNALAAGAANVSAPPGWKYFEWELPDHYDRFGLYVPNELIRKDITGVDSVRTEFQSDRLVIALHYGPYTGGTFDGTFAQNIERRKVLIGGKKGEIVTWDYNKDTPPTVSTLRRKVAEILFPQSEVNGSAGLEVTAYCADSVNQQIAIEVFKTIRFISGKKKVPPPPNYPLEPTAAGRKSK